MKSRLHLRRSSGNNDVDADNPSCEQVRTLFIFGIATSLRLGYEIMVQEER